MSTMDMDIKFTFRTTIAKSITNKVAIIAKKLSGWISRIRDQSKRVERMRRVIQRSSSTKTLFVQEVVALPACVDDASRARRLAAGAMDFRSLWHLVVN